MPPNRASCADSDGGKRKLVIILHSFHLYIQDVNIAVLEDTAVSSVIEWFVLFKIHTYSCHNTAVTIVLAAVHDYTAPRCTLQLSDHRTDRKYPYM